MKSNNRIILTVLVILLAIAITFTSGCTSKQDRDIAGIMKALPANTNSLFVFNYEDMTTVPALSDLWDNLAGDLLPEDITPCLMAVSSRDGILTSLVFTFEETLTLGRLFPADVYTDRIFYRQTEIVQTDNGLDLFMFNSMLVVVMMDEAEAFIDDAEEPTSSMYTRAIFQPFIDASLEGALVYITETASVTGLPVAMGVSINTDDAPAALKIKALVDYTDGEKAAAVETTIETYLATVWALENIEAGLDNTIYEIKAELAPDNVSKFLDGITRES